MTDQKLLDYLRTDRRYPAEAYQFLCEAVEYTQVLCEKVPEESDHPETDYHVSGPELCRGACALAAQEFGYMAHTVFRLWGVHTTDDLGQLVFNLIDMGLLSQSEKDDIGDFHDLFCIEQTLNTALANEEVLPQEEYR
jgi:uncharacterized repeat protein (TIGR04138 family)